MDARGQQQKRLTGRQLPLLLITLVVPGIGVVGAASSIELVQVQPSWHHGVIIYVDFIFYLNITDAAPAITPRGAGPERGLPPTRESGFCDITIALYEYCCCT